LPGTQDFSLYYLRLFFFKPDNKIPGGSKNKTGQTLIRIVRERADYEKIHCD
jgi:hypothetical protein